MKILFGKKKNVYKANLHTHTTISDGRFSPEEVKRRYKEAGYSVLAYTDHELMVPHDDLNDENFLTILSYEASINEGGNVPWEYQKCFHLNFYSKDPKAALPPYFNGGAIWLEHERKLVPEAYKKIDERAPAYGVEGMNDLIERANNNGFFVCWNHPVWSSQDYRDCKGLKGLWGVEVYNTGCCRDGYEETEQPFEDLLYQGEKVFPVCSDDMHGEGHFFGGYTMIEADELEYSQIINALIEGDFYSSTGPAFKKIAIDNGNLIVECSAVKRIFVKSSHRWTKKMLSGQGATIDGATFDLQSFFDQVDLKKKMTGEEDAEFIRVVLVDEEGNKAFSRPYYLNEIRE